MIFKRMRGHLPLLLTGIRVAECFVPSGPGAWRWGILKPAVVVPRHPALLHPSTLLSSCALASQVSSEQEVATFDSFEREGAWESSNGDGDDDLTEEDEDENLHDPLVEEWQQWTEAAERTSTALQKKYRSLENEMRKAESVEETVSRANLLTTYAYLFASGVTSVDVEDWETGEQVTLTLNPSYESATNEANALFQQARKLKRGSEVVSGLLDETSTALETLREIMLDLEAAFDEKCVDENVLRLVQDRLIRSSQQTGFAPPRPEDQRRPPARHHSKKPELGSPASNVRKLLSPAGCVILVGRNRRGNEYLSMTAGRGNDIWMHSRGCPGAHVLIQQRRGCPAATDSCLQLAANLAVFYSDARNERKAEVPIAEPKHILKPRNAPLGAVKLRKETRVMVGFPDDVPDEFKMAREESGQSVEYRASDKAKHRRRTQAAAKQQRDKKKARRRND